jgi:hypothetical protein
VNEMDMEALQKRETDEFFKHNDTDSYYLNKYTILRILCSERHLYIY